MRRRNISLTDEVDDLAREAGLNVSALTQTAILRELDRQRRMASLDAWLDELDAVHGPPSARAIAEAETWAQSAVPVVPRRGVEGSARRDRATPRRQTSKA